VTGSTSSSDFPTTGGVAQPTKAAINGATNAFVSKLSFDGTTLLYSTFLGGTGVPSNPPEGDSGNAAAVDTNGSAFVTGSTWSTNFPTFDPYQATSRSSGFTSFVTKLNPDATLAYSTY